MFQKFHNNRGFTLVELSVVMVIIGIIIGGVLKGQELVLNARIKATLKDFRSIEAAAYTFIDKYSQWPGDMINATTRVSGCDPSHCGNGDGTGLVGFHTTQGHDIKSQAGFAMGSDQAETSMFWKHIALSGLIKGVDPSADVTQPAWGKTHPQAVFPGGYMLGYKEKTADHESYVGHYVMQMPWLTFDDSQSGWSALRGKAGLTAHHAWRIDRMGDDGSPFQGFIHAYFANGCLTSHGANGEYNFASSEKNCIVMYFLQR